MNGSKGTGPSEEERRNPGDTDTNPTGGPSETPAEGADDSPPPQRPPKG
ncbi:hypothetical protein M9978_18995 [Sphingomonas sp. MG17]|uniref:Uncharacterized protein n=1 Tax=Sphingomonas tagetis TaxID=2949092 RepID=A0A9X2HTT4_9SPHN|nr:hypothetical protein [Sphingomonas tagetis]MCP3732515.1 hypothetical protein [Sphingomonas tagetis]